MSGLRTTFCLMCLAEYCLKRRYKGNAYYLNNNRLMVIAYAISDLFTHIDMYINYDKEMDGWMDAVYDSMLYL